MSQDVFENREFVWIRKLSSDQWNNQYGFFPFGVKPKLRSQILPILVEYVEGGYLYLALCKVRDGYTSSSLIVII